MYKALKELSVIAMQNGISIVKPNIYRTGATSTVAVVKDAFLADKDDNFDFENFLNILRKVEKTLDDYKKEKNGKK